MIGIFTTSGQAPENQQETDYMARLFITSLNLNERKVLAPEVQASCACRCFLDRSLSHSGSANRPLCQEETEVIHASHFLFFSPDPARASHWPNANRSQKLKIQITQSLLSACQELTIRWEEMQVDLEMPVLCEVKKHSVNTLMYFTSVASPRLQNNPES